MARDFDGASDEIGLGNDASIQNFSNLSIALHSRWDGAGSLDVILSKISAIAENGWVMQYRSTNRVALARDFTGGRQTWAGNSISPSGQHHVTVTQNASPTSAPVIEVDGAAETVVELEATASGTLEPDSGTALSMGDSVAGTAAFDGALQNVVIANAVLTAAEKNRHRWWGCAPGGPSTVAVWLPMYTDVVNRGTATLSVSLTGTTVSSMPTATQRPGMGTGW